jgi:hypothetical protein
MGWFGAVFAGFIAAQKAFIEELESQIIKLKTGGVIYGGDKYLPNGGLNTKADKDAKGFWLGANGEAKLEGTNVSGHIVAKSGEFKGTVTADAGELNNVVINESCTVKGKLEAQSIKINGGHEAVPAGQNGHLIAMDNHYERINYSTNSNDSRVVKTLRIAGKGSCTIRVKWLGYLQIQTHKADGTWDYFPSRTGTLKQTIGTENILVTLYNDVNVIHLVGWAYYFSGTGTNFESEDFKALSKDDPGLFKFMSGPA